MGGKAVVVEHSPIQVLHGRDSQSWSVVLSVCDGHWSRVWGGRVSELEENLPHIVKEHSHEAILFPVNGLSGPRTTARDVNRYTAFFCNVKYHRVAPLFMSFEVLKKQVNHSCEVYRFPRPSFYSNNGKIGCNVYWLIEDDGIVGASGGVPRTHINEIKYRETQKTITDYFRYCGAVPGSWAPNALTPVPTSSRAQIHDKVLWDIPNDYSVYDFNEFCGLVQGTLRYNIVKTQDFV